MSEKTPLVLIPGLLNTEALWAHQQDDLMDIATVQVADITREDNMADLARNVLRRAPKTFALGGLSMGGYVALEIMRQAPERVERLALVDTSAAPDSPVHTARRKDFIDQADRGDFLGVTPRLLPVLVHKDHIQRLAELVTGMSQVVGKMAFIRQQTAIMHRLDSRPMLKGISCPTAVICGDSDKITTPAMMREVAAEIGSNAVYTEIKKAGHLSPLEQPDCVTQALREWLLR